MRQRPRRRSLATLAAGALLVPAALVATPAIAQDALDPGDLDELDPEQLEGLAPDELDPNQLDPSRGGEPAEDSSADEATVTDHVVTSFDGTPLATTLFVPASVSDDEPAPLVLRTHGFGGSRETSPGGTLARLLDEGYAVLTWDSRGFGCSGGEAHIDDPDIEGRDVSALIDFAVAEAPIAAEDGDPLVGMTGGSYAGGIQTAGASVDGRIDALAPEISWEDLRYSLYSGEVVNQGWVSLLYALGTGSGTGLGLSPECDQPTPEALDPAIHRGVSEFLIGGEISEQTLEFFAGSSIAGYGQQRPVDVPTLVMQGSVDTLFDLTDGHRIYQHVRETGTDARFLAFCGGHVACPGSYADADDRAVLDDAIIAWFDRHLRGEDVDVGAPVTYRTNEGVWRDARTFDGGEDLKVDGTAEQLPVVPVIDVPDVADTLETFSGPPEGIPALPITSVTPGPDGDPRRESFEVTQASDGPLELRGIPEVELEVSGETVPLDEATEPLGELTAVLPNDQVGEVLVDSAGPLGSISGGLVSGIGADGAPLAGADGRVHVFVSLVHREADEVVNLQQGAIRVDITDGTATVDVPMSGVAYTIPEGDHLDLQISTASLMHATGRTPALIDVAATGSIPATSVPSGLGGDRDDDPGEPGDPDDRDDGGDAGPGDADDPVEPGGSGDAPGGSRDAAGTPEPPVASRAHDDGSSDPSADPVAAAQPSGADLPITGGDATALALLALGGSMALRRRST